MAAGRRSGQRLPGRPELTARRFTRIDGLPAYRTGDLACLRADGQLGYLGRADDEVKISGHRIDPAAVESVLLGLPAVREAAVVVQELGRRTSSWWPTWPRRAA